MKSKNKSYPYYQDLNIIRVLACLAILLYHLGWLKGGFLAVCLFFVLTSFLTVTSAFKKTKFSLKEYYLNRFQKIYLPLLIVVFLTIMAVSFIPKINWLNLKPETTSVLLGYNNYWQLSANLDYFAHHISSPFMHLWYIAILLQFEIVFPFIFLACRKLGEKTKKFVPSFILGLLTVLGIVYFYYSFKHQNIMHVYYDTLSRSFSLIFGLLIGFLYHDYGFLIPSKLQNKIVAKIIFGVYLIILLISFIFIDASSVWMPISMILVTIITGRLISYGSLAPRPLNIGDKIVKSLANISYEIYLWQYPLIFFLPLININYILKLIIFFLTLIGLSYLLYYALNGKRKYKYLGLAPMLIGVGYGIYVYIITPDHSKEMQALEQELAKNALLVQEKQEEYAKQMAADEAVWAESLKDFDLSDEELNAQIANLPVVGIGDSVMLGAINNLYDTFSKGYFDAKISRTAWVVNDIVKDLKNRHLLGDIIILNLGANGDCPDTCKTQMLNTIGDREIFWLNVTNDNEVHFNDKLTKLAQKYPNIHIVDWVSASRNHPEYFVADGLHLTASGRVAYTKTIHEAIFNYYKEKLAQEKAEAINKHDEEQKSKLSFYGNDLLLNTYEYLSASFTLHKFNIKSDYDFTMLKTELETEIANNTLPQRIVFLFDTNLNLTKENYTELLEILEGRELYVVAISNEKLKEISDLPLKIIDFTTEMESHANYLSPDKIHLTLEGNIALKDFLLTIFAV